MSTKLRIPESGEVYEVAYPFVRETHIVWDEDGSAEVPTWRPGTRNECRPPTGEDVDTFADGMGKQSITIIGTFKPGRFPLRVFYTRKWTDPDGKVFGKDCCRITTIHAFRSLVNGYRHRFEMAESTVNVPA